MQRNKAVKTQQSKDCTKSTSKCSVQKGMLAPVRCALAAPQAQVTHLTGSPISPKSTVCLSTAVKILQCFETIAECISVPGLRCPFRILIGILTIVKDIKDNCEDARRLLALCEKHLGIALDFINDGSLSTFSGILEHFIQILLEINENTGQIKNRSCYAALRYVLSDKERLQAYTQKLNDGLFLFLNGSFSEADKRRVAHEAQLSREITGILNRIETKIDTVADKLDRISSRLDDVERRICPEPLEGTEIKWHSLAEIIALMTSNMDIGNSTDMSCPLNLSFIGKTIFNQPELRE